MTDCLLTIAIPTYNRAELLIECLDNILNQFESGVDILIRDNASTDSTQVVVQGYLAKYSFIRYSRNHENIGPDANFLACLQEGKGDFIQLLSDDDILLPGALQSILRTINSHRDISVIRTNCCAFQKQFKLESIGEPAYAIQDDIVFSDKNEFLEYVGFASIFMSTTIYNKKIFDQIINPSKYIGTSLLQTHLIFECLAINSKAMILAEVCVAARVGMAVGFNQVRVLVVEWKKVLYGTCIGCKYDSRTVRNVYDKTIRQDLSGIVREAHLHEASYGFVFKLIFVETWMFPSAWVFLYPYALLPKWLLKLLSLVKRKLQ